MVAKWLATTAALALTLGVTAARADCTITVGLVMELTGPAGEYGQAGAKSVEMAFRDLNDAGGP
ncbi:MAG: amino acid ABC transporter substrate-binding protein, partial [Roseiarcus sp.]